MKDLEDQRIVSLSVCLYADHRAFQTQPAAVHATDKEGGMRGGHFECFVNLSSTHQTESANPAKSKLSHE